MQNDITKTTAVVSQIFLFMLLLVEAGCESVPAAAESPPKTNNSFNNKFSAYTRYTPVKIDIMPLTEFICVNDAEESSKINVYVSLLDSFDCQIKTPGIFRFELYERVPRSAEPKGKRITIWPDIDLIDPVENNEYWRDFLRTYKFSLDFEPQSSRSYILQVTCLCPNDKRFSAEFELKHTE